jgi:hypothetical protein
VVSARDSEPIQLGSDLSVISENKDITDQYVLDAAGDATGRIRLSTHREIAANETPRLQFSTALIGGDRQADPNSVDIATTLETVDLSTPLTTTRNTTLGVIIDEPISETDFTAEILDDSAQKALQVVEANAHTRIVAISTDLLTPDTYRLRISSSRGSTHVQDLHVDQLNLSVSPAVTTSQLGDDIPLTIATNAKARVVKLKLVSGANTVAEKTLTLDANGSGQTVFEASVISKPGTYEIQIQDSLSGVSGPPAQVSVRPLTSTSVSVQSVTESIEWGESLSIRLQTAPGDTTGISFGDTDTAIFGSLTVRDTDEDGMVVVDIDTSEGYHAAGQRDPTSVITLDVDSGNDSVRAGNIRVKNGHGLTTQQVPVHLGTETSTPNASIEIQSPTAAIKDVWRAPVGTTFSTHQAVATAVEAGELYPSTTIASHDTIIYRIELAGLPYDLSEEPLAIDTFRNLTDPHGNTTHRFSVQLKSASQPPIDLPPQWVIPITGTDMYYVGLRAPLISNVSEPITAIRRGTASHRFYHLAQLDRASAQLDGKKPQLSAVATIQAANESISNATVKTTITPRRFEFANETYRLSPKSDQQLHGTTSVSPGSPLTIVIRPSNSSPSESSYQYTTVVGRSGSWIVSANLSTVETGTNFTASIHDSLLNETIRGTTATTAIVGPYSSDSGSRSRPRSGSGKSKVDTTVDRIVDTITDLNPTEVFPDILTDARKALPVFSDESSGGLTEDENLPTGGTDPVNVGDKMNQFDISKYLRKDVIMISCMLVTAYVMLTRWL